MSKESTLSPEKLRELTEKAKKQTEEGMKHLAKLPKEKLEKIKEEYGFEASEEEKKKAQEERELLERKKKSE